MANQILFHYAFPISDIGQSRTFYAEKLGCIEGRSTATWIDFDFFGHQLSAHIGKHLGPSCFGHVDGKQVPIPHYGCVLSWDQFWELGDRLRSHNMKFELEPHIRYAGEQAEQATMFLLDPDSNALEFKAFKNPENIFLK